MASVDQVKAEDDGMVAPVVKDEGKLRYKSWRKKYRKMRLVFEGHMEEANRLFISEQKSRNIARRILEENDQILDILVDINEDPRTSALRRWDLGRPSLSSGELPSGGRSLQDLERRVTHTKANLPLKDVLPPDLLDLDDDGNLPPSYLPIDHEEEYLALLDASLSAIPPTENLPPNVEAIQPTLHARSKQVPTDRDFAQLNPNSVHNWLKRNQPQVFDQQKEKAESEKGEDPRAKTGVRGKKEKAALSKQDLQFEGLDDEIGFDPVSDVPGTGSARGRKKKDDDAYRPKGGHSRGGKRKRERDDYVEGGKIGKKPRRSGLSMGEDAF